MVDSTEISSRASIIFQIVLVLHVIVGIVVIIAADIGTVHRMTVTVT
jgi:hypothetical protein